MQQNIRTPEAFTVDGDYAPFATLNDTTLHEVEAPVDDSGLEPPTKK